MNRDARPLVRALRTALVLVRARLGTWCPVTDCEHALGCRRMQHPDEPLPCQLDALIAEAERLDAGATPPEEKEAP